MKKQIQHHIEQPLGRVLSYTGRNFLYLINKKLSHLDIERNFYSLLLIEQANDEITQQDLADMLNSDKVSVVRIVDYLSGLGYVIRVKKKTDKRKYSLQITDKAKKDLPVIKKALKEVTTISYKGLSSSQIADFSKTLEIIKNNINHHITFS